MTWAPFLLALAVFVGSHYLPARTGLREVALRRFGRRAYFSVYGLVSLAVLGWVVVAAGHAPYLQLWPPMPWMRWVPNLAMPLALVLTACGLGLRQPWTLGAKRGATFDPADPGLAAVTRHPLLWALALWAGAHLLVNGDLAHVVLFGLFLAMALGFMPVFDARARRDLAASDRAAFFAATSVLSLAPFAEREWRAANLRPLAIRSGLGLALWIVALALHGAVIGVSPLPL
ncbi:NnrU family protein [Histidinibacterium aquaticum]|uniref:NnrU family protein n=1 Tax=Histidinibacterium aquaticum TaxID=2613962 RepID=A0A5J5GRA6_9RHOB|nr:NnrU family protein [Histidinibacterium aquaticum]KAA9010088.1 NnrU family protein [Histidinibacterium aquaticum]